MTSTRLIAALVASLSCSLCSAITDCTSTVRYVYADAGTANPAVWVGLASGASFVLQLTDVNFKVVLTLAQLAMTTQKPVTARFAASGLNCASDQGRTDLIGFNNYGGY